MLIFRHGPVALSILRVSGQYDDHCEPVGSLGLGLRENSTDPPTDFQVT